MEPACAATVDDLMPMPSAPPMPADAWPKTKLPLTRLERQIRRLGACRRCNHITANYDYEIGEEQPVVMSCGGAHPYCPRCAHELSSCHLEECKKRMTKERMRCQEDSLSADGPRLWHTTPLVTQEEEDAIRYSWWRIANTSGANGLKGLGVKFIIGFLKGYPQYQRFFQGFADIPIEQLEIVGAGNFQFTTHATTFMAAIGGLVFNLNDTELLSELLIRTGRNHARFGLKLEDFGNLMASLLEFLGKALGEYFTVKTKAAWTKALTMMGEKIGEGLAQGQGQGQGTD